MYVLGVETSCDETAAAVIVDGRRVLSNVVYSQAQIHRKYGGVVPEVASRDHLRKLPYILQESLDQAGISLPQIGLIGVTKGPGLVGCLLVGLSMAKGLAYGLGVPIVGVSHLEGHIFAHYIERGDEAPPPFVALIASGGHTLLVYVHRWGHYEILGETRDDAAGEAFDKVGKLIGLDYPAGAALDQLARRGDSQAIRFPRPLLDDPGFDFSFAGLKTAVVYYLRDHSQTSREDLAASFQEAVVDILVEKTLRATQVKGSRRVVIVGGVAANSRLRELFHRKCEPLGLEVHFPSMDLCTDNAAMIAAAANFRYENLSQADGFKLPPQPSLRL